MGRKTGKLTAEHKAKIGEAQRKRYLELRELPVAMEPTHKPCSRCRVRKPLTDFYWQKKKTKSGVITHRPRGECKECTRAEKRGRYAKQKAEDPEKLKARKRRFYESEDAERRRARDRGNAARRRREEGRPVLGPRCPQRPNEGEYLAVEPLAAFLEGEMRDRGFQAISEAAGIEQRRLSSILAREYKTVSLRVIDQFLSGLGVPHELHLLYPEEP